MKDTTIIDAEYEVISGPTPKPAARTDEPYPWTVVYPGFAPDEATDLKGWRLWLLVAITAAVGLIALVAVQYFAWGVTHPRAATHWVQQQLDS